MVIPTKYHHIPVENLNQRSNQNPHQDGRAATLGFQKNKNVGDARRSKNSYEDETDLLYFAWLTQNMYLKR
ncbi:unnamed protein product [Lactuca virosa]|uniref:Uncharacterized protein n=1 Tax=Lactuca virosa TaxID=75947 RepID=A0AAU9M0F9_9ASTR|nr:unnamed protein product [Lactuca virosa]